MYLLLRKIEENALRSMTQLQEDQESYCSYFTESSEFVRKFLKHEGNRAFQLDGMKEVEGVDAFFNIKLKT